MFAMVKLSYKTKNQKSQKKMKMNGERYSGNDEDIIKVKEKIKENREEE